MGLNIGDKVRLIDAPQYIYDESIGKVGTVKYFGSDVGGDTVVLRVDEELWVAYKNQLEKLENGGNKAKIVFVAQYPDEYRVLYDNRTERKYKKAPTTVLMFIKRPDLKVTQINNATFYNDVAYRKALHEC